MITVFCFFYREEFLVPFFLSHYRFAHTIHAFVTDGGDRTRELLSACPKVVIEDVEFPNGMDDLRKTDILNKRLNASPDRWSIVVDADEFVWPPADFDCLGAQHFLNNVPETVLMVKMWNVYRHKSDTDLDATKEPIVLQRRHGAANRSAAENLPYQKPIVIRGNRGFQFLPGNHALCPNPLIQFSTSHFDGAHWQNADPMFCVARRVRDRRDRQSELNRRLGLGAQHHHTDEADVLKHCSEHLNDPLCF